MGYPSDLSFYEVSYHKVALFLKQTIPETWTINFPTHRAAIDFRIRFGVFRNLLVKSKDQEERETGLTCRGYKMHVPPEGGTLTFVLKDTHGYWPAISSQVDDAFSRVAPKASTGLQHPVNGSVGARKVSEYLQSADESPASEDAIPSDPSDEDKT